MRTEISTAANGHGVRLGGKKQGWNHWTTPAVVLEPIRALGPIMLDPCANGQSNVGAAISWTGETASLPPHGSAIGALCEARDGLVPSWHETAAGGLIFVNPPYSAAKDFVAKACVEGAVGAEIVMLVAARTDTRWAHNLFQHAHALCFWGPGRIRFDNPPPGSAGDAPSIPSMLAYFGRHRAAFCRHLRAHGQCFDLVEARKGPTSFPVRS